MRPTIFLTSFHILISRNILASGVPKRLAARGFKVVILAPDFKASYFEEHFGGPGIVIQGVPANTSSRSLLGLVFKRLAQVMLPTTTARIKTTAKLMLEHKYFYFFCFILPARLLGYLGAGRSLVRRLDRRLSPRHPFFASLIARYQPAAVVSTDVNNENDVALMQEARLAGVTTLGIVRSWDNLTNFFLRVVPDGMAVANPRMADEAVRYHGVPRERLRVVGIPHYDRYLQGPTKPRAEFLREIGADPGKPLILYVPVADSRMAKNDVDAYVVGLLSKLDATILVRFPPTAAVSLDLSAFGGRVIADRPGHVFRMRQDAEIRPEDDERLVNALAHCDVVVSGPGTMNIDAALFDRPLVLVNCYPTPRSFWGTIREYRYDHIQPILASGGARIATSAGELEEAIKTYLHDPRKDAPGRARIREEQCWRLDGASTERVTDFIARSVVV
ncbi:MAG: hypothetical protein Q8R35_04225 [bacterium]|nr:hypothetical protein [bacterium]